MGFSPIFSKKAFTFENGRLPKNPLFAENGLGCVDSTMKWRGFVIMAFFLRAGLPQRMKALCGIDFDANGPVRDILRRLCIGA